MHSCLAWARLYFLYHCTGGLLRAVGTPRRWIGFGLRVGNWFFFLDISTLPLADQIIISRSGTRARGALHNRVGGGCDDRTFVGFIHQGTIAQSAARRSTISRF